MQIPAITPVDLEAKRQAEARQAQLTKPAGSLGRLESIAVQLAAIQSSVKPELDRTAVLVFAGDHGVVEEGVSAFPQEVTPQMVANFLHGGAAINALSQEAGADLIVADLGVAADLPIHPKLIHKKVAKGTANFAQTAAMTAEQMEEAVQAGIDIANNAIDRGARAIALGEMGIGNTTPAAAITTAVTGCRVLEATGRGTGLDDAGVAHKAQVIERALELHKEKLSSPQNILQHVGGFEIAGLVGAIFAAAARNTAVIVDGYIATSAAVIAAAWYPECKPYLIASHCSVEPGHQRQLDWLGLEPVLRLDLRLGEGSGAALVIPVLKAAVATHNQMATFEEAAVSGKSA